ncbi:putative transcription factor WD40-like family [Helianthus anomalus]
MKTSTLHNKKSCSQHQILDVFSRELGFNPPRIFHHRFSASEGVVSRIGLAGNLIGHERCVNTVEFNRSGDRLVSGSDDRRVVLWNVASRCLVLSYDSGHADNVLQARIMPFSDERSILTSATDGQVRLGQVADNGKVQTKRLGKHDGCVHKLAVEPGSPYIFYSCGEDGLVQQFDLRSDSSTKLFCCSTFTGNIHRHSSPNRLNSITIDPRDPNYFSLGGSDEYARVYDIRKLHLGAPVETFCPKHLIKIKTRDIHITGMSYSNTSELLVSYTNEHIYLFQKNMGLGPYPVAASLEHVDSLDEPQMYSGRSNSLTVKGVSFFGPGCEYVMSGSDCGRIFIWKKKDGRVIRVMEGDKRIVNQVEPHPNIPVLASTGLEKNIKLWAPVSENIHPLPRDLHKIMESNRRAGENHSGVTHTRDGVTHVLRLQRRQGRAYVERRRDRDDAARDEEDESDGNPSECNIV